MRLRRNFKIFFWLIVLVCLLLGGSPSPALLTGERSADLLINELMASNGAGLADEDGDYPDWIELYNQGSRPINLSGWALTDDPSRPDKWSFPDVTLGGGQYLLVFASGKNRRGVEPEPRLHTNFRLRRSGDFLGLYRILDRQFVDTMRPQFPEQIRDVSYGRYGGEPVYGYLETPTPGLPNDQAQSWTGVVAPIDFSVKRGFYDLPFTVSLSTNTPGATVYYTIDGSEPTTERGQVYHEPLQISTTTFLRAVAFKPDMLPSAVETHTYIFLEDVLKQPANPAGFPAGADYEMDPIVVNDPRYSPLMRTAFQSIPSLSIVSDVKNLDIYQNPEERGTAWERPVSVELIETGAGKPGFQINAGIRIQGGVGRLKVYPKHSFRLFFKRAYGPTKLNYPLFPDSPVEQFDTLVLRGGVNRSYAGYLGLGDSEQDIRLTTYTRDEWLRSSQIAMSGVGSHGIFVHLYLNGLYWGLYNVVERPDASFMAAYFGGEKEVWFAANQSGPVSGDSERFDMLHQLARRDDLAEPKNYAAIQAYLDAPQFIDYLILNFYSGNIDWAHNNWYAGVRNPGGQVNYFAWDGEKTWFDGAKIYLGEDKFGGKRNLLKRLVPALMKNDDFKMAFADRLYQHLFNHGALTDASARARWLEISAPIEMAIIGESARWGDVLFEPPLTQADWRIARDNVLEQMEGNGAKLIQLARQAGYYPAVDPPIFNQQGGVVPQTFEVTLGLPAALAGTTEAYRLYYTTDGSDPRLPGGEGIVSGAILYQQPIVLTTTTQIKTRLLKTEPAAPPVWSALNEAIFKVTEQVSRLQISEIMYNPLGGADYEFIELKNNGSASFNLANMSFEGIDFTFPPRMPPLEPGQVLVLAHYPEAFAQRYPNIPIAGVYEGQLSNGGETLVLKDSQGNVIISISYDDENGWPLSPDGRGDSLVMARAEGDPNDYKSWQASANVYGSPGVDDALSRP